MLLIFDEASGIPDSIWSVAQGFFTENTPNRFHLAFSNPRRNTGYFYETFNSKRSFWHTRNIDAREVEGTDKNLYQQIIDEYGPDSYQANVEVYGQFPSEGDDQFIAVNVVDDAMRRPRYKDASAPIAIGVDPARFGSDATVIAVRQGRDIVAIKRMHSYFSRHEVDKQGQGRKAGRLPNHKRPLPHRPYRGPNRQRRSQANGRTRAGSEVQVFLGRRFQQQGQTDQP